MAELTHKRIVFVFMLITVYYDSNYFFVHISGGSRISPRRGRQLPRGGRQHMILPIFPENCMKLKEFGPPGGGARPKFYYVDPPLHIKLDVIPVAATTQHALAVRSIRHRLDIPSLREFVPYCVKFHFKFPFHL